ncbi:MAG: hypothetical protein QM762_24885 [Chryseolinea sp.]
MKLNQLFISLFLILPTAAMAQTIAAADSTGLPGDNFSLEGALDLFKESSSPEDFEKRLNTENNKVNNLDLNDDGETDYIRVVDKSESDAHAFILQAVVSESESQDVAVVELEKSGNDGATAQIVGDEDIYGHQTIVEPTQSVATNAGTSSKTVVVNVVTWPMVRYVYAPGYRVWVSPWRWRVYPAYWRPWRPVRYSVFYGYRAPYHRHYAVVSTHRVVRAHRVYVPVRTTSVTVVHRNEANMTRYRSTHAGPNGTVTRTSTTVHGSHGNKATRQTTTVKGKNGKVKQTKVRRHQTN